MMIQTLGPVGSRALGGGLRLVNSTRLYQEPKPHRGLTPVRRPVEAMYVSQKRPHKCKDRRGAGNGNSKLTEQDVQAIRSLRAEGVAVKAIHEKYPQVHIDYLRRVISGKKWSHLRKGIDSGST